MNVCSHEDRTKPVYGFFRGYSLRRLNRTVKYVSSLPSSHQQLLKKYRQHLDRVRLAIEHNNDLLRLVIANIAHMFENADHTDDVKPSNQVQATAMDMDKVQGVLKQFVREWSSEGSEERQACFQPILDAIESHFPSDNVNPASVKVLVPGAGLGRLAYEIARRGYCCQGNEFSFFMLFASNFVLNSCKGTDLHTVYPWVHQYYNHMASIDQIQPARFPDANPADVPRDAEFSMTAGNFIEVYANQGCSWDSVATCFFLDTAGNIVLYIETIYKILKPGGVWVNLGPLLYHYADLPTENSIEPSYEDVKDIIKAFGFDMLEERTGVATPYTQNPRSMMRYEYKSVYFVCRKPFQEISSVDVTINSNGVQDDDSLS
ncbi:carnosine N-methyltransferase-like isoform X2 [Ornithodoros turicata]|uniref:carnosine N-methyltransferase-like isoform X2 n=1 Tax=Ornithodoros turicata TaxID=34597 RepID=UPI0031398E09